MATRAEVIERVWGEGCATDSMGESCRAHFIRVDDFYGMDYILISDEWGRMDLEVFDHVEVSGEVGEGYFSPVQRAWDAYYDECYDEDGEDRYL